MLRFSGGRIIRWPRDDDGQGRLGENRLEHLLLAVAGSGPLVIDEVGRASERGRLRVGRAVEAHVGITHRPEGVRLIGDPVGPAGFRKARGQRWWDRGMVYQ